ncbi:aldolase [Synechococcus sp. BSF8S]|uniref:aldolase/citrate lyase family protein n=2 Tax=Synechococcales TaxID=1890424 RepID=UPI0016289CFC|nr:MULTISPECIES: aldolase/citrate lyase family protein [unclassified Synechococcus]MBC1260303.1 aldolase [Synechococcus sp. BSF8S]MBC1263674.1 aldolase [Synechococcus sp. BSA11S]
MNTYERKMLDLLKCGREEFGVLAAKAEFEAEGTRADELLRLLEIVHKAGVGLALKIGGCEAIRDMLEARQFGVRYIIAPMVETPYALSKYIAAVNKVFTLEEQEDVTFLFNVETVTAFQNIDTLVDIASGKPGCDGIVFGRVDYSGSIGVGRAGVESEEVTAVGEKIGHLCAKRNLDFVVGGAVSIDAFDNLRRFEAAHLKRFETRKVVFDSSALSILNLSQGLRNAVHFELLWLLNKREYYGLMYKEDDARIDMLESRWKILEGE